MGGPAPFYFIARWRRAGALSYSTDALSARNHRCSVALPPFAAHLAHEVGTSRGGRSGQQLDRRCISETLSGQHRYTIFYPVKLSCARVMSDRQHEDGKPRGKMRPESYSSLQSHTPQPAFQQGRPGRCKHKCGQNTWVKPHRRRSHQFDIARS